MSEITRYRMVRACLVTAPDACLFEHPMGKYAIWADCKAALAAAQERIAELEKERADSREIWLRQLNIGPTGKINMTITGEAGMILAGMMVEYFYLMGGDNFVTQVADVPATDEHPAHHLEFTIRNCNGKLTPAEKIADLEAQNKELKVICRIQQMTIGNQKETIVSLRKWRADMEAKLKECRETTDLYEDDHPAEEKNGRRGETADETIRRMESAPRSQHVLDALRTACEAFHDGDDEAAEKKEESDIGPTTEGQEGEPK